MQGEVCKQSLTAVKGSTCNNSIYTKQWNLASNAKNTNQEHLGTNNNSLPFSDFDSGTMDSYTAGIELSNAWRNYYVNKEKSAEILKQKLIHPLPPLKDKHTQICHQGNEEEIVPPTATQLQAKMRQLKEQLVSLIDMDLTLMKQFLILNEQIEELKWQRKMHTYKFHTSSKMSSASNGSSRWINSFSRSTMSSTDSRMLSAEYLDLKYPTPSELSLFNACYSTTETLSPSGLDLRLKDVEEEHTSDLGSDTETTNKKSKSHGLEFNTQNCDRTPTKERFQNAESSAHIFSPQSTSNNFNSVHEKRIKPLSLWSQEEVSTVCNATKSSTLASTGSNESTSTESNSVDSGISDHDMTVEFVQHV